MARLRACQAYRHSSRKRGRPRAVPCISAKSPGSGPGRYSGQPASALALAVVRLTGIHTRASMAFRCSHERSGGRSPGFRIAWQGAARPLQESGAPRGLSDRLDLIQRRTSLPVTLLRGRLRSIPNRRSACLVVAVPVHNHSCGQMLQRAACTGIGANTAKHFIGVWHLSVTPASLPAIPVINGRYPGPRLLLVAESDGEGTAANA